MTHNDTDTEAGGGGTPGQWLGLLASTLGAVMALGIVAAFASTVADHGFNLRDGAILAVMLTITGGLATLAYRLGRRLLGRKAQVPSRERRSRNILIGSCLFGLVTGMVIAIFGLAGETANSFAFFTNSSLSPAVAIGLALIVVVIIPLISWQWHRSIDEHERDAYRAGAVAGGYLFLIGAPAWWLLWRGGLAPQPDGVVFYYAFCLLFGIVWLWKKYR